ncbi:WD repeat-containing protein 27-like isoform X2 [Patiria miniata]|uniref:WD repeat-containing protein 27 n=1 Tax=Patiria miniata TaxID=46514 RepID=A0A914BR31_PATMI|nr:WD repeat-containing protein 27-like isoform X2 [Patiria miniata]
MAAVHQSTLTTPFAPSHLQLGCNGVYLALPVAKSVGVWSLQSLSSKPLVLEAHKKKLSCLCFGRQHNPTLLCSAAEDYIIVWNVEQARNTYDLGDQIRGQIIGQCLGHVQYCSFSYDDALVAVCIGCEVLILDSKVERLDTTLEGHMAPVTCAEFCPYHPATLVSVSEDRTFKIWDITRGCLVYQSCIISASPFLSLAMNTNSECFAVGSSDGQVRIFDLTEGNGYRCLHQLDIAKLLRTQRETKELDKNSSTASGPRTISSHPAWKRPENDQPIADGTPDDSDFSSEAGEAILGLHFTTKVASTDPSSGVAQSKPPSLLPDDSLIEELLDESPMLVVGTPGALLQINTHSFEMATFIDFQDPIPSGTDQHYIALSGSYAFAQMANSDSRTWCIIGSVFENAVDVIQLRTPPPSKLSPPPSKLSPASIPSLLDNLTLETSTSTSSPQDDDAEQLTVISSAPLSETSVLRSEMTSKPKELNFKTKPQGGKTGTKKPSGSSASGVQDQALTFKSKIKSSGYTGAPRAKMFSPKTNVVKTSSAKREKAGSAGAASRSVTKQYPIDADPPTTVKTKIDVGNQSVPINSIAFSGDGQNLACALANKSAQLFKMPLTGKGTSFTGHNAAVNTVHWSHDGQWLLTAADDKTARIWSKSASDPVLTLSHIDRSVGATDAEKLRTADKGSNRVFAKEVKAARFYYVDKFLLLASGGALYLHKFVLDTSVDDIKRYQSNSRYKLVKSFQLEQAQQITALSAVNGFHSYIVMCAGSDKSLEFFDMNVGRSIRTVPTAHSRPAHCICQNEGSAYVSHPPSAYDLFLTAAVTDSIKLWDLRTNRCVKRFEGHMNRAHRCGVAISPCAKYIATGSEDKSAYVFDIRTGTYIHKLSGHTDVVSDVAYHPLYPEVSKPPCRTCTQIWTESQKLQLSPKITCEAYEVHV